MAFIGNTSNPQTYVPQIVYFSGNASTTSFTLPFTPASTAQVLVHVANVAQNPASAYTIIGNTITFTSAPPTGSNNIWIEYASLSTQAVAPSAGTVNTLQLGTISNINSVGSNLTLQTNGNTIVSIGTNGIVGVGTTSPSETLDVNGAIVVRGQTQSNKTSQATVDFGTGTGGIRYLSWGASGTNGTHSWWQGQGNAGATQTLSLNTAGSLIGTVGYFAGPSGASVGTYGISTPDTNYSLTLQRVVGSSGNLKLTGDDSVAGNPNLLFYNTRTSSGSGISYDVSNYSTNLNLTNGTRSWINNGITSVQFTVANNTAQLIASYNGYGTPLITLPSAAGNVMMAITVRNGVSGINGNFWFGYVVLHVAGSSAPVSFNNYAQSGSWASTTGVLSGTTGSSGNITLSSYTNSGASQYGIYVENRFSQAMNFCVTFIGLTQ